MRMETKNLDKVICFNEESDSLNDKYAADGNSLVAQKLIKAEKDLIYDNPNTQNLEKSNSGKNIVKDSHVLQHIDNMERTGEDTKEIVQQYIDEKGNIFIENFPEEGYEDDLQDEDDIPLCRLIKRETDLPPSCENQKVITGGSQSHNHGKTVNGKGCLRNKVVDSRTGKRKTKHKIIYKCHLCSYETGVAPSLQTHIKGVHLKQRDEKCDYCDYSSVNKQAVNVHVDAVHLKKKDYKCEVCDFGAPTQGRLKYHQISMHQMHGGYKCEICDKKLISKFRLNQHLKSVHLKIKTNKCKLCDYEASLMGNIHRHMRSVHSNTKNFACHLCAFTCYASTDLKSHISGVHLKLKNFECHLCDYAATLKGNLRRHLDTVHLKKRKHKCSVCDYSCLHAYVLQAHINTMHMSATFPCDKCEKSFGTNRSLKQHLEVVHSKDQGHRCELCDYCAYRKSDILKHYSWVHLNQKKFKCLSCDFETTVHKHLLRHMQKHSDNKI